MSEPTLAYRARVYAANGHRVIPIPFRAKAPKIKNWGDFPVVSDFEAVFPTDQMNIGVVLGAPSGGLADVDLDCEEAIRLAAAILPDTNAKFGRASKPQSHWLYRSDAHLRFPQAAIQFRDPVEKSMMLELRLGGGGKAAQTVFPYSTHESGEPIEWDFLGEEDPARVDGDKLRSSVSKLAAACLLKRYWPQKGSRHQAQLALANWLIRRGRWTDADAASFLTAVAGDPGKRGATVTDAMERNENHDTGFGYPTLAELIDERAMNAVATWLEIPTTGQHRSPPVVGEQPSANWPKPDMSLLSPPETTPPTFPIELFGEWGGWIREAAEAKGAPADYVAATLLTVVSSFIGNTRVVSPWQDWTEPPILWMAIVGNPSAGKSPAMDSVLGVLDALEREDMPAYDQAMGEHRKKVMISEVAKSTWKKMAQKAIEQGDAPPPVPKEAAEPTPPLMPRYRVADATTEKLVEISTLQDRGVLMVRDELAGWLASLERYNSHGGREFFLEAFGARRFRSERVKLDRPQVVGRLSVGILGSIQPDKLFSRFLASEDDGLVARFFYVWPNSEPISRPTDTIDQSKILRALRRILDLDFGSNSDGEPAPIRITLTAEAISEFQNIREECRQLEESSAGMLKGVVGKFPGGVLRIACAFIHLDWAAQKGAEPAEIDTPHIKRARAYLFDYLLPMAKRCFGDAATAPEVRASTTLARWVHEDGLQEFTVREIQRKKLFGLDTAEKVRGALDVLTDAGWVRYSPEESGGRPRQLYRVNPAVLAQ